MKEFIQTKTTKLFWLQVAFIISLAATLWSIALSEVFGLVPCLLCWWQRIFMYPLPFILGAALTEKKYSILRYTLPMASIGAVIAAYHYVIQLVAFEMDSCGPVSCTNVTVQYFGFITIPFGSFLAFTGIIVSLLLLRLAPLPDRE